MTKTDFRIKYTYYNRLEKQALHEIDPKKVRKEIQNKSHLSKNDILNMLKNDGCNCLQDSLRVYNSKLESYVQVIDDERFNIQDLRDSGVDLLSFWVKTEGEDLNQRIQA